MNAANPDSTLPEVIRERLMRLSELQEMGLLTDLEYELKKREILAEATQTQSDTVSRREMNKRSVWLRESAHGHFEVEVNDDHVSTRGGSGEHETALSCTLVSYASRLGTGGQVRALVEREMPADAVAVIDAEAKRRLRKSNKRVLTFWLVILVVAVAYALLRR
jgi:hypothetical protein